MALQIQPVGAINICRNSTPWESDHAPINFELLNTGQQQQYMVYFALGILG
jgi:hypothetical protein